MTSTTWTAAPSTDLLGSDCVDVRKGVTASGGRPVPWPGTGMPAAGCVGPAQVTGSFFGPASRYRAERFVALNPLRRNDSTTPGLPSPAGPLS